MLNNLNDLEMNGVPLMMNIRSLTFKLARHIRQMEMTLVNDQFREYQNLYNFLGPLYDGKIDAPCYVCYIKN